MWNGAGAILSEEEIRAVVDDLEPASREKLRWIARGFDTDEVSVVIWLHENSQGWTG